VTPQEIAARFAGILGVPITATTPAGSIPDPGPVPLPEPESESGGSVLASISAGGRWARAVVDVSATRWREAVAAARDDPELACDFLDYLCGVDETGAPEGDHFSVVAHLWSIQFRHGILLRTALPAENPELDSVVSLFPGAAWYEREAHEMYGIGFAGHPGLLPLLLPEQFDGHPLRKDFILASRVAKAWPGAKEPGESEQGTPARRRIRPPGVPDPADWGPDRMPADPTVATTTPPVSTGAANTSAGSIVTPPDPATAPSTEDGAN
jgi:NADH-quinone oxidoreductase subunit C